METKEQLIEKLQGWSDYYQQQSIFKLLLRLVESTDENDSDFKQVLADEMGEEIIRLFMDCYDTEELLKWLDNNDYDLFMDYRYSDRIYRDDYESDEDFEENSGAFYKGDVDCLMYNEKTGCYVKTW